MTIEKLRPTFALDQNRVDALRAIAPEAFADDRINWKTLREALVDRLEVRLEDGRQVKVIQKGDQRGQT